MTRVVVAIALVILLGTACDQSQPAGPSPVAPPSTSRANPVTVSGVVYEATSSGLRALAGAGIDLSPEYNSFPPQTTTDAAGHYTISGPAEKLKVIATKAGYSQPCRAPVGSATDGVLDIHLVPDDILSTTGVPSSMPIRQPTVSGFVFERAPEGAQPIPGATVVGDFSGGMGWAPSATTKSDATGRYMICGVSDEGDFGLAMYATSPGYAWVEKPVDFRATNRFDIELTRQ